MTDAETQRLVIRGVVAEMPQADQNRIYACLGRVRDVLASVKREDALMAIAILGSELSANPEMPL